jgi:glucose dehydrogenase
MSRAFGVDVTPRSAMKVSAASQLVPSRGAAARPARSGLLLPLLAASLACIATFSATADENWREPAGAQWSIVGGDWHNSRYSTLNRINTQTVVRLAGAWTSQKFDAGTSRATPVVKDGVMFVTAGASVYALNVKTGETLWQHGQRPPNGGRRGGAPPPPQNGTSQPQGSPSKEGVALGDGLVFAGLADAQVIALREKTGELAWSQYVGDTPAVRGQAAVGAPTYAAGPRVRRPQRRPRLPRPGCCT